MGTQLLRMSSYSAEFRRHKHGKNERYDSQYEENVRFLSKEAIPVLLNDAPNDVLDAEIERLETMLRRGYRVIPTPVQYDVAVKKVKVVVAPGASRSARKRAIKDYMTKQTRWEPAVIHRAYKLWTKNASSSSSGKSGKPKKKSKSKKSKKSKSGKKKKSRSDDNNDDDTFTAGSSTGVDSKKKK